MQRFHDYVEALEEEKKKIQVFQRDLPLAFELVTKAIDSCRKELSTSENVKGQSDCSEKTTDECGGVAVFEEFIPIKMSSSSSDEPCKDDGADDKKKSDWLRSVQLWNPQPEKDQVIYKKATVVEIKRKACAFQMEKPVAVKVDSPQPLKAISQNSTAETSGSKRDSEEQKQSQAHKKQRRYWSQELHRRFLHALQQLGGSHVATPKQIRDLMKVDSLTSDEVKSHLQKHRLHKGRPATPAVTNGGENLQQPQFMVVEGIWVPSHDAMNNRIYAPVAAQPPRSSPSGERSSRRCKSPATSSSTHTPHILPLSRLV